MQLGIDFGTTRTIVAAADRGNYPVVGFVAPNGDICEHFPSIVAEVDGELIYGLAAELAARAGAPSLRSFKRLLSQHNGSTEIEIGTVRLTLLELITGFLTSLRQALRTDANLPGPLDESLPVVVAVPANSHSTQRFVTLEAFRRAGFTVVAMLNEPSAAALEYAHRYRGTLNTKREHVVVYDLGGGTFDSALVLMAGGRHDVLHTSGISRLGGDDFDECLLDLALQEVDTKGELPPRDRAALLLECRIAKEAIHPNTRRVVLDLAALGAHAPVQPVVVAVADYYERVRPLIVRTLEALEPVLQLAATADSSHRSMPTGTRGTVAPNVAGIYVVGGGSGLPLVPRVLRERYARRVHRSVYSAAATAIGLAIAADEQTGPSLTERFTRHFGVFRERDTGVRISFDSIFAPGTPMPQPGQGPLVVTRRYRAAHNLGVFRYVECSGLNDHQEPRGDITPHGQVCFAFVDEYRDRDDVVDLPVARLPGLGPQIEERYEVDEGGIIAVTIADLESGYARRFVL